VWDYDHFYGPQDHTDPTYEGWTTLAAMAVVIKRARIGCMVSGVTYRNPAILAKMAVTVDHISAGRLDFGIGAGWHEAEHRGYGIEFPSPSTRVAMVDEALTVIRRLWIEKSVTFTGQFFNLENALCEPSPFSFHTRQLWSEVRSQRCLALSRATPTSGICPAMKARRDGAT